MNENTASETIIEFLKFDYIYGLAMILVGLVIFWMSKGNSSKGLSTSGFIFGLAALGILTFFGLQHITKEIVKFDSNNETITYQELNYDLLLDDRIIEYHLNDINTVEMIKQDGSNKDIYHEIIITFNDGEEFMIPTKTKAIYEQEKNLKIIQTWLLSNSDYEYE